MEFKVGDVVRLQSGGPAMTIQQVETRDYEEDCEEIVVSTWVENDYEEMISCTLVESDSEEMVVCAWTENNVQKSGYFMPAALELYEKSARRIG